MCLGDPLASVLLDDVKVRLSLEHGQPGPYGLAGSGGAEEVCLLRGRRVQAVVLVALHLVAGQRRGAWMVDIQF